MFDTVSGSRMTDPNRSVTPSHQVSAVGLAASWVSSSFTLAADPSSSPPSPPPSAPTSSESSRYRARPRLHSSLVVRCQHDAPLPDGEEGLTGPPQVLWGWTGDGSCQVSAAVSAALLQEERSCSSANHVACISCQSRAAACRARQPPVSNRFSLPTQAMPNAPLIAVGPPVTSAGQMEVLEEGSPRIYTATPPSLAADTQWLE